MHFDMMMLVLILEARDYARNSEMEDAIIWPLVEEQMSSSSIWSIGQPGNWDVLKHWSPIGAFCLHVEASPDSVVRVDLTPLYVQKET